MATPAFKTISIDEIWELPEDGMRHELLNGEHVVTPAPSWRHQRVLVGLINELIPIIRLNGSVELLISPADIRLGERILVQPDLFLVHSVPGQRADAWQDLPVPLLVVEILSPSTAHRDRGIKKRLYLEAGVAEYWVVDAESRTVERWREGAAEAEILRDEIVFSFRNGFNGMLDLAAIWDRKND